MQRIVKHSRFSDQGPKNQWRDDKGLIDYGVVIDKNTPLMLWVMKLTKFVGREEEREDLLADMKLGLCRAAELFDPTVAKWGTYATRCLINVVRRTHAARNKEQARRVKSLPSSNDSYAAKSVFHTTKPLTAEDRDLVQFLFDGLEPRNQAVVKGYFLDGKTYGEIGTSLDPPVTKEWVRQIINASLKIMRRDAYQIGLLSLTAAKRENGKREYRSRR